MKPTFDLWSQKDYIEHMNKSALVRARIEPALKRKAEKVLAELGLNASDAIHLLYRQVALHQALPFPLHTPNAATAQTLQAARKGQGTRRYRNKEELFKDLGL